MSQKKVIELSKLLCSSDKKKVKKGLKQLSTFKTEELASLFEGSGLLSQYFVIDASGKLYRGTGAYAERYEIKLNERFSKTAHGQAVTMHWLALNGQLKAIKHLKLQVKDASLLPWIELSKLEGLEGLSFEGELPSYSYLQPIKPLKHLSLVNAYCESSLTDLPQQLESLILADLELEDLTDLSHLSELKSLKLWGMGLDSLNGLAQLQNLVELELDAEDLSDISELAQAKSLKSLQLSVGCMEDPKNIAPVLEVLSKLTQLEQLILEDLSGDLTCTSQILLCLSQHTQLHHLSIPLDRTPDNLSGLSALPQLTHLALHYELCQQVDIRFDSSALTSLVNLESLSLGSNLADEDLQNLNQLPALKSLTLKQTSGVTQLGTLNLEKLETLSLTWWPETYQISEQEWSRLVDLKNFKLEGYLPDPIVFKQLKGLEKLDLIDVELTSLNSLLELQSLKHLKLVSCPVLSDISALNDFPLEQLVILNCPKLKGLKAKDISTSSTIQYLH